MNYVDTRQSDGSLLSGSGFAFRPRQWEVGPIHNDQGIAVNKRINTITLGVRRTNQLTSLHSSLKRQSAVVVVIMCSDFGHALTLRIDSTVMVRSQVTTGSDPGTLRLRPGSGGQVLTGTSLQLRKVLENCLWQIPGCGCSVSVKLPHRRWS
ncbi:uncharacterized protein LAESUDRAFT_430074 [Laetiporus sulphureus 93-53]|uniref:Uncharacterized protein n=1 Tax=Laetiporus sulphureus 93-53 TaxID=1314785 RepID=A0A165GMM0_9APHY|nr:uncharacterized protein LAESUDRAFT_430074 [Laetiporus sulphureus 93-53]KZT10559.1 hypothetical protein LAESUDRAFT_430074 [Laetiporus sulphureus 93-53]